MKKICLFLIFGIVAITCFATTIYDVQYTTIAGDGTYPSLLEGDTVTLTGIVTAIGWAHYDDNYFISMPEGGPWKGVLVYFGVIFPEVGDEVEITGVVSEYYGMTEISNLTNATILSSGNPVPDPIVVETGNLIDPVDAEQYEGCLVNLLDVTVTEEQIEFGQWYVNDGTGDCQMDDGFFYLDEVVPPIVIILGDVWASLTGMVDYSYDEYGVHPRTPDDMIDVVSTNENMITLNSRFIGCYPNPFNPQTTALFNIKKDSHVTLSVYNIRGEKIKSLVNRVMQAGQHSVVWNGTDNSNNEVSSGIYFFEFDVNNTGGDYTSVKKVILMK
ncbi:MAG: T9SS type A sorting domain-containing protein [Candidatus Cloacimonetes bacterium]|nr:T9SS type A sorting domain-containing protein [Candidatus Cloacimonadota bacterium]